MIWIAPPAYSPDDEVLFRLGEVAQAISESIDDLDGVILIDSWEALRGDDGNAAGALSTDAVGRAVQVRNGDPVLQPAGYAMLAGRVPIALRILGYDINPLRAGSSELPPDTTTTSTPADPATTATTQQPIVGTDYTVVAGDYLVGIATRANTTVDALVDANTWPDGINHALVPGEVIKLP